MRSPTISTLNPAQFVFQLLDQLGKLLIREAERLQRFRLILRRRDQIGGVMRVSKLSHDARSP